MFRSSLEHATEPCRWGPCPQTQLGATQEVADLQTPIGQANLIAVLMLLSGETGLGSQAAQETANWPGNPEATQDFPGSGIFYMARKKK